MDTIYLDNEIAKIKLQEYADRFDLGVNDIIDFSNCADNIKMSFLLYIIRCIRYDINFGIPNEGHEPSFYELYQLKYKANCGIYCHVARKMIELLGYKTRFVRMKTIDNYNHMAMEIEISDNKWFFVDVLFQFWHLKGFFDAREIKENLCFLTLWEDYYSIYVHRYGKKLSDYFYEFSYDKCEV